MLFNVGKKILLARIYLMDYCRDIKYSTAIRSYRSSQEKMLSAMIVIAHTLEKGLTMPNKRFPFGVERAKQLALDCQFYRKKGYDERDSRYIYIIGIIKEYVNMNQFGNLPLEIFNILKFYNEIEPAVQKYNVSRNTYFIKSKSSFEEFAISRHSCRNLSGHVEEETLMKALEMSMSAPSTCNRQSVRLHILSSSKSKNAILQIQTGCRGFGNIVDQFLLITSDLSDWPSNHLRNAPYVDGGIFLMNLLYSLHYFQIGACTLNMFLGVKGTRLMHSLLSVPENEVPIALVAIGIPPEEFDIANSKRRQVNEILTKH